MKYCNWLIGICLGKGLFLNDTKSNLTNVLVFSTVPYVSPDSVTVLPSFQFLFFFILVTMLGAGKPKTTAVSTL